MVRRERGEGDSNMGIVTDTVAGNAEALGRKTVSPLAIARNMPHNVVLV